MTQYLGTTLKFAEKLRSFSAIPLRRRQSHWHDVVRSIERVREGEMGPEIVAAAIFSKMAAPMLPSQTKKVVGCVTAATFLSHAPIQLPRGESYKP